MKRFEWNVINETRCDEGAHFERQFVFVGRPVRRCRQTLHREHDERPSSPRNRLSEKPKTNRATWKRGENWAPVTRRLLWALARRMTFAAKIKRLTVARVWNYGLDMRFVNEKKCTNEANETRNGRGRQRKTTIYLEAQRRSNSRIQVYWWSKLKLTKYILCTGVWYFWFRFWKQ